MDASVGATHRVDPSWSTRTRRPRPEVGPRRPPRRRRRVAGPRGSDWRIARASTPSESTARATTPRPGSCTREGPSRPPRSPSRRRARDTPSVGHSRCSPRNHDSEFSSSGIWDAEKTETDCELPRTSRADEERATRRRFLFFNHTRTPPPRIASRRSASPFRARELPLSPHPPSPVLPFCARRSEQRGALEGLHRDEGDDSHHRRAAVELLDLRGEDLPRLGGPRPALEHLPPGSRCFSVNEVITCLSVLSMRLSSFASPHEHETGRSRAIESSKVLNLAFSTVTSDARSVSTGMTFCSCWVPSAI